MIGFSRGELHLDGDIRSPIDVALSVVADFDILVDGTNVYSEKYFPVVELAAHLRAWRSRGLATGGQFEFTSLESDGPVFRIRRANDGWVVDARGARTGVFASNEIGRAIDIFVVELRAEARDRLGVDIDRALEEVERSVGASRPE